ncbi:MAG: phosphoserine phosphatase [Paraglaciecola sp.]
MFERSITSAQLASSLFLDQLADDADFDTFGFSQNRLISASQYKFFSPASINTQGIITQGNYVSVVIFAEGLSLQKVLAASASLSEYFTVGHFQMLRMPYLPGQGIVLKVQQKSQQDWRPILDKVANEQRVELCLVDNPPNLNEPGLLVMDMDSTAIGVECIDEMAVLAGVGDEVSRVTEQAMQGKLDFAQSLISRVSCLAGADASILDQVRCALPLMPGLYNLVKVLKHYHWKLAIASGGFTYFADHLAECLELDWAVANELVIIEGKLTGQVAGNIVDAQVKADTLGELASRWGISASQTVAMGDGANDLLMMNAAALGVAFHAKPVVRQQADISIRQGSLDALLWVLAVTVK